MIAERTAKPVKPDVPVGLSVRLHGDEFPADAHTWLPEMSRRQFLELMGASLALAGVGACNRPPEKEIVPYVNPPDRTLDGRALFYATAMSIEGFARGILVESHQGRPTKIEGNPQHPESLGATDAITQAAVLSLYDPDRSRAPRQNGTPATWEAFESEWLALHHEFAASRGTGFALLAEPTTSPTLLRQVHTLLDRFPAGRWYQHTPLARRDREGTQEDYDFSRADVVLAVDADFLAQHPASLRYGRAFASRRRVVDGRVNANRLYAIEPTPTLTGAMADHRLPVSPARMRLVLNAIAQAIGGARDAIPRLSAAEQTFVRDVAADLQRRAPNIVCVAGPEVDSEVHAWAAALNARLGAIGVTVHVLAAMRSDRDSRCAGDLNALTQALTAGEIRALVIAGANPVYTAPTDLAFAAALAKAKWRVHLGSHVDETAVHCDWHLPESHFLETWGDLRAFDGTATIQQPLIAPLYATRSEIELVHFLGEPPSRDGYDLVRETWQTRSGAGAGFDARWTEWLNSGIVGTAESAAARPAKSAELPVLREEPERAIVLLRPDPTIRDGRWSNNGWLQELPKPITNLVWDNAALVSAEFAASHQLAASDVVRLRTPTGDIAAPIWITPGQATDCITLHLGYGRTHAGGVGNGHGVDAYRIRSAASPWCTDVTAIEKIGHGELVSTQHHFRMEGRDIVRVRPVAELSGRADAAGPLPEERRYADQPSLYPEWRYPDYRWAMSIDLATCIGCSACVIACQAENNIPVVGKEQVARGREMHWIRVDRYFAGDLANPQILHQPVPCMQCENAPCELVCPVAATVHSSEGLNDMVYNRCIGTRYCSNNCPYKVRRFNFLDFRAPADSPVSLQKNPGVSVRDRGVMEKCTYCVQRINAARINAEKEMRRIRDGEVRTACQQACPVDAIVFGDLSDPTSAVGRRKREPTNYTLLEELNTRPRTTYLAKTINPRKNEPALEFGAGAPRDLQPGHAAMPPTASVT
jgi:Fe-S-cluster-containing dehydrogenase component